MKEIDYEELSTYGQLSRILSDTVPATTAATSSSGYMSVQRMPTSFVTPAVGSKVKGWGLWYCNTYVSSGGSVLVGIEYDLGQLTVSTNTFEPNASLPLKSGADLSSPYIFAVITTTLVATTPVLTIGYTDNSLNSDNSITLTLPTNALINSAFWVLPNFASQDRGIKSINTVSISTGASGVIKFFGILPLKSFSGSTNEFIVESGETVAIYRLGSDTTDVVAFLLGLPQCDCDCERCQSGLTCSCGA